MLTERAQRLMHAGLSTARLWPALCTPSTIMCNCAVQHARSRLRACCASECMPCCTVNAALQSRQSPYPASRLSICDIDVCYLQAHHFTDLCTLCVALRLMHASLGIGALRQVMILGLRALPGPCSEPSCRKWTPSCTENEKALR